MAFYDVFVVPVENTAGHLGCLQLIVFNTASCIRGISAIDRHSCSRTRLSSVENCVRYQRTLKPRSYGTLKHCVRSHTVKACFRSNGTRPMFFHHLSLQHNVT